MKPELSKKEFVKFFKKSKSYKGKSFPYKVAIFFKVIVFDYQKSARWNGWRISRRLNPCNPISYFHIIVVLFIVLIMEGVLGVIGLFEYNPFKWIDEC